MPARKSILARVVCAAALCALAVPAAEASVLGLSSDGRLGPSTDYFTQSDDYWYEFDTDDGKIREWFSGSARILDDSAKRVVSQPSGPDVVLYEFTTFDLPADTYLRIVGERPAAILATGDITISDTISVRCNRAAGGDGGSINAPDHDGEPGAPGPYGGRGGQGRGIVYRIDWEYYNAHAGGGGGGGNASPGQPGYDGQTVEETHCLGGDGGAALTDWATLVGGGAGGGGGSGYNQYNGGHNGGSDGGDGGGAVLFGTPGDLTITPNGAIYADGVDGEEVDVALVGDGGGGAGGYLVFEVDGTWINHGLISARGGKGGDYGSGDWSDGGSGAGGKVLVDPEAIYNHGTIDVSCGDGAETYQHGGLVILDAPVVVNDGEIIGQVPEPATLSLLALGGLALIRRKR